MTKTLGQIAEDAWIALGEAGENDPDKLWEAAAEAVQARVYRECEERWRPDRMIRSEKIAKVIEAARDYILLPPRGDDPRNYDRLYVLQKAVEALEEMTRTKTRRR